MKRVYYWQGIQLVDTPLALKTRSDILVPWYVYGMCSQVLQICDKHIHSKGVYYGIYMYCIRAGAVILATVIVK